ncbi:MAG: FMN-binding protein [Frankiales bacterium]|nr:FMN-binding protein [Frankiales bacterium]
MRRIVLVFLSTLSAVVLLFGYRTSTPHPVSAATTTVAASGTSSSGSSASTPTSPTSTTVTGSVAQTRWGAVQVQITVSGGKVTAATAVQVPSENGRDVEINDRAVPVLDQQAVDAQSADLDGVSGATVTSDGYKTSLQSALDAAGL